MAMNVGVQMRKGDLGDRSKDEIQVGRLDEAVASTALRQRLSQVLPDHK